MNQHNAAAGNQPTRTLVVSWTPPTQDGIKVVNLAVNDGTLVANHSVHDSPLRVPLGPPLAGKYKVAWTIETELNGLNAIDITIHNDTANTSVAVGHKDNPTRGSSWSDATGTTVNAP